MADDGSGAGNFFSFLDSPWAGVGAAGLGAGSDIWSMIQNLMARNQQQNIYKNLSNPAQLAAGFPGLTQQASAAALRDLNSNYALNTGGAPGGAYSQFISDAMAKIEMDSLLKYLGIRTNALQGAGQQIPGQQPLGALGGILKSLQVLRGLGGGQQPGLVASGFPATGGFGPDYTGSSDYGRSSFPPPVTLESGLAT